MAYTLWNEAYPPNSLPANQIHLAIQYWAVAIRERLNDVFGTSDWATAVQPFQPSQINFRGATPAIRGGSASFRFRNNADSADNATISDVGDITARRNIVSTNNLVSNNDLLFNAASARILPGATKLTFRNFLDTFDNLSINDAGQVTVRDRVTAPSFYGSTAATKLVPGATSFSHRDSTDNFDNLLITEAGDVTARGILDFASINNNKPVTLSGQTTLKKLSVVFVNNGNSGAAKNIDWSTGNYQYVTLDNNCVFTFLNPVANTLYWFRMKQGGAGGFNNTVPANVIPTPVTPGVAAGHSNLITMFYDGTDYLVMTNLDYLR